MLDARKGNTRQRLNTARRGNIVHLMLFHMTKDRIPAGISYHHLISERNRPAAEHEPQKCAVPLGIELHYDAKAFVCHDLPVLIIRPHTSQTAVVGIICMSRTQCIATEIRRCLSYNPTKIIAVYVGMDADIVYWYDVRCYLAPADLRRKEGMAHNTDAQIERLDLRLSPGGEGTDANALWGRGRRDGGAQGGERVLV